MTTNFKIISFTEIEFDGKDLDLHNNYSFVSVLNKKELNQIEIHFEKSKGDWIPEKGFRSLTFTLMNIHYLRLIEPMPEHAVDDGCLAGITFYYSDDREENFALVDSSLPKPGDDIIFTFESDRVIRINCDAVILTAKE